MNEPLMIGARGWEVAEWIGDFYPGELPDDWRFCYYSNNLRSVLVPQDALATASRADVERWIEDSDPAFRFVLELPAAVGEFREPAAMPLEFVGFTDLVELLAARSGGWLLRVAAETPVRVDAFETRLHVLAQQAPLCVDLPEGAWREPALLAALDRQGVGLAWHCVREAAPRTGGSLMVAQAPVADARTVRHWIEKLAQWQAHPHAARAGLFLEPSASSARGAQEARLIAELMGV